MNFDFNKTFLLQLNDEGEPITNNNLYGDGVLTLPSIPYKESEITNESPLMYLRLLISAGSPITRDGLIWTNCPPEVDMEFQRDKFYKKKITSTFLKDDFVQLRIFRPGSYVFYMSFKNGDNDLETTRKIYFTVPPSLTLNGQNLQFNSINCQTVVSKWVGKDVEKDWYRIFEKISEKNYNMIHFTPLVKRGDSNSPYSIYDQLLFDPEIFPNNVEDVAQMVSTLRDKYKMLSLTDMVFNHTANNSKWIIDHPEVGYNHITAPHLTAAIELDAALLKFSERLEELNYPVDLKNQDDLLKVMDGIKAHVIDELKLWQFYVVDIPSLLENLQKDYECVQEDSTLTDSNGKPLENITDEILNDRSKTAKFLIENIASQSFEKLDVRYSRSFKTHNLITFLKKFKNFKSYNDEVKDYVTNLMNDINLPLYQEYDDDVGEILEQLYNRINYMRIDGNGLKQGPVTKTSPLTEPYFTRIKGKDGINYALANNGWIWNGNPLVDFASPFSKSYLRREVIVWGDCVKLRYGAGPDDSPYLWQHMSKYVEINAKIFDGFRIDNCHSTPIHVGEFFLDLARKFNPNLYVVAELFTGSEHTDCLFVERLGISSLIREAMQAWSEGELASLCYKYGGRPVGSYKYIPLDTIAYSPDLKIDKEFCMMNEKSHKIKCVSEIMIPKMLLATPPHAMFMDCTHDNQTPNEKRTVEDALPNAALVGFCSTAIGSVYGYDEIYPNLLDLVNEKRSYFLEYQEEDSLGISHVKKLINDIRKKFASDLNDIEDSEMHVHQENQYITFHRTNTKNGNGYYLVARTKFNQSDNSQILSPIELKHTKCKLLFSYSLKKLSDKAEDDSKYIKGIRTELETIKNFEVDYNDRNGNSTITLPEDFRSGSIAIFETQHNGVDENLDHFMRSGAIQATETLTLDSLNAVLYKCEAEELDSSSGKIGAYDIPDYGKPVYCGLQGWVSILKPVMFNNDLAHPISNNLRNGYWALDYIVNRLDTYIDQPGVSDVQKWLKSRFEKIKELPYYLAPTYFALLVGILYQSCRFRAMQLFPKYIGHSTVFLQSLAMTSIQMNSTLNSTSIFPTENVSCMAAGLPHFSTSYMRCWGRDVFISLRGLLLITGRHDQAKNHILAFAKTLKHGLIPNLLDAGRNPRFNARDAAWFFMQAIKDYVDIVPNGETILKESITRRFPKDDTFVTYDDPKAFSYSSTIEEIMYEILSRHAAGIKYREANAGYQLDRVMKDDGFNVEVHVDWNTGLIHGGSQSNCGTWMDKMGESSKANSVGVPGTPRDGAAVEINGLLKSALRFVIELEKNGNFNYKSVKKSDGSEITFEEWDNLLQENFEKNFYVPIDPSKDSKYEVDASIVNRRGIYKDLKGSGKPYEDYQLRPNFLIAMSVAPELFDPHHAQKAVEIADEVIRGPLGMRTLDPNDYNYNPDYNNSEDTDNFATSKGRNYHQGPEWVWCYGYFLRAYQHFHFLAHPLGKDDQKQKLSSYIVQQLYKRLKNHRHAILTSPWAGLPELTNKDGKYCNDSSPTQAWSTSCLIDLFYDIWRHYEF